MLPALSPTQTVSSQRRHELGQPDCRIQWHRYRASPPFTSRTSSPDPGNPAFCIDARQRGQLQHPNDFQPSSHMGQRGSRPLMNRHASPGPVQGCPYVAVGMQSASDSPIGLPRRSTSASGCSRS
jgi:hypothetical protein